MRTGTGTGLRPPGLYQLVILETLDGQEWDQTWQRSSVHPSPHSLLRHGQLICYESSSGSILDEEEGENHGQKETKGLHCFLFGRT